MLLGLVFIPSVLFSPKLAIGHQEVLTINDENDHIRYAEDFFTHILFWTAEESYKKRPIQRFIHGCILRKTFYFSLMNQGKRDQREYLVFISVCGNFLIVLQWKHIETTRKSYQLWIQLQIIFLHHILDLTFFNPISSLASLLCNALRVYLGHIIIHIRSKKKRHTCQYESSNSLCVLVSSLCSFTEEGRAGR